MTSIQRTRVVSQFNCLGDQCSDTCCKGWSMQVDEATVERYRNEAPDLLAVVEPSQDAPWIMRKDAQTGCCVKLEGGWCGIHKARGSEFLGDACYFYPRVTRALGGETIMTATTSCPEIVRLLLEDDAALEMEAAEAERLPHTIKDYLPDGLTAEGALAVHRAFLDATHDATATAEHIFSRIASVSRSIELIDKNSWPQAVPFYLKNADMRLPEPETNINDPFNLLHALAGLIVASQKPMSDRLRQTVEEMEKALSVKLDWQQTLIHTDENSLPAYKNIASAWQEKAPHYAPILKRWLAMQLSLSLYPFAGLGANLTERITLIGVRLATLKLALMCAGAAHGDTLPQDVVIRVMQSLSRFLDHLGDPAFSLQIYTETGWVKEARMRGVLAT